MGPAGPPGDNCKNPLPGECGELGYSGPDGPPGACTFGEKCVVHNKDMFCVTLGLRFQGQWERWESQAVCSQFGGIAVTQVPLGYLAIKVKKDAKDSMVPQDVRAQKVQKVKM